MALVPKHGSCPHGGPAALLLAALLWGLAVVGCSGNGGGGDGGVGGDGGAVAADADPNAPDGSGVVTDAGPGGPDATPLDPATMAEFWTGNAYFQHVSSFKTPTPTPVYRSETFNADGTVTADVGGTWYMFHRELYTEPGQTRCPAEPFRVRTVVRTSTDRGVTWSDGTTILSPTSPYCQFADGDVYFDSDDGTWHTLYQCLQEHSAGASWAICHASRTDPNPIGAWTMNPSNPVLDNGYIWDQLSPSGIFDEGTPDIVEKNPDGSFHVTFHGVDWASVGVIGNGYRGAARASGNFTTWSTVNSGPIFGPSDTTSWQVPWEFTPKGGGHATTMVEGGYYYMIVEAADLSAFITQGQNWAHGLLRSTDIASQSWTNAANNPVISSKRHLAFNDTDPHPAVGTIAYPRLFRDGRDVIYLMHGADAVTDRNGTDPITGHHLHVLTRSAPLIDFTFRAGPRDSDPYFVRTDGVSRGRGEGLGYNVTVSPTSDGTHEVRFNASNARVDVAGNPFLMSSAGIRLRLDVTLHALPGGSIKSHLIAGQVGAFWLEVYDSGGLCFWVDPVSGDPQAACRSITLDAATDVIATYTRSSGAISISVNGDVDTNGLPAGSAVAGTGSAFVIGSAGANGAGFYGSPNMTLRRLRVYDQPDFTEESPAPAP